MYGNWSKVWQQGEVDMRFWHSYHPNTESLERFSWQFQFERKRWPDRIPNWAWGHALDIGLLRKEDVPTHIPKDFDWPKLQSAWSQGKAHGSTASVVAEASTSSDTPHNATEDGLTAADNDTEKKQPEGCEKDPKSMEESEEKPTEGCKKDPKPVTPQPGAAQLWLGGLKTMEEREENKNNKGNTMK